MMSRGPWPYGLLPKRRTWYLVVLKKKIIQMFSISEDKLGWQPDKLK